MSPAICSDYVRRIEDDLRGNILPFWIDRVVDHGGRGFFGSLTNDLAVDHGAVRGSVLTSRILWTYSAAYARYRDPAYLAMADHAYGDLQSHFLDPQHGGYRWSIAADGAVLRDFKHMLGQAFSIYALAEYHAATGRREPLDHAIATYRLIEEHAAARNGGYLDAVGRAWEPISDMRIGETDLNEPKSQDAHLHLMEAYTRLLAACPEPALRSALEKLVRVTLDRIFNPLTGHLGQFFAEDWTLRSDLVSYGHDIEAAWLLTLAADVLKDGALTGRIGVLAVRIAETTLAEGVDSDGGVYYHGGPGGPTDTNKEWWPQAEAVVGFLNAYQLSRQERFLAAALRTWDFIEAKLIDHARGEWFRTVTREGRVLDNEPKVSFWKCPYHNGRTGLEATRRLRELSAESRQASC
ncbi:MAG TPA: AGE family epimerase/isomerase [Dongiaceae bacterium]|nr:AGE family epimerase/isomerase [Dongiaceae bacterium]